MRGLLIADKDVGVRQQMADLFTDAGYDITVTNSAPNVLYGILKGKAEVVLLGSELDDFKTVDLIPVLKKCNRHVMIILIADDAPLPLIRKFRREGIFYHALRPVEAADREEIRTAVECAFKNIFLERPGQQRKYS